MKDPFKKISDLDYEGLRIAEEVLNDKLGEGVCILNVSTLTSLTDFFVIATGNNPNHLRAMADAVEEKFKSVGIKIERSEGSQNGHWILLDFAVIIVHIFDKESRAFYDLEHIWADAPRLSFDKDGKQIVL